MESFAIVVQVIHQIGLTLGVGSSTFALVFYIKALEDQRIDASEKNLMHAVYTVLRIGMVLIVLALVLLATFVFSFSGVAALSALLSSPVFLVEWTLMGVIIGNAILMSKHRMPMWLGPTLAGGSWYSLFFLSALPLGGTSYSVLFGLYLMFLIVFLAVFTFLKRHYTRA